MRPDLSHLAARLGAPPLTRFAPSPTGYLHLGHVVNAIYVWGVTRRAGGRVLLRIEDHDRLRSRPHFETALLDDLDWLGFVPDEGRQPLLRQRERTRRYDEVLARLRETRHVYACACSRRDIAGTRYSGRCRHRQLTEGPGCGLRVELGPGVESFTDLLLGPLTQTPDAQCGDLLIRDRDGHWTYQYAVTVDDMDQGITLVIRGADLVSSTGRQIRLARLLGRVTAPRFLHHPLILRPDGHKLSKSSGDAGVRELRARGLRAEEVIGRAAAAIGLLPQPEPLAAADVDRLFA